MRILIQKWPFQYFSLFHLALYVDDPAPALAHIHLQGRKEYLMLIVWEGDSFAVSLVNKGTIKYLVLKKSCVHANQQPRWFNRYIEVGTVDHLSPRGVLLFQGGAKKTVD